MEWVTAWASHSLRLCSIQVPAYLAGKTHPGSRVLWVGPSSGSPAWTQAVAQVPYSQSGLHRLPGASPTPSPGLWHIVETTQPPSYLRCRFPFTPLLSLHLIHLSCSPCPVPLCELYASLVYVEFQDSRSYRVRQSLTSKRKILLVMPG